MSGNRCQTTRDCKSPSATGNFAPHCTAIRIHGETLVAAARDNKKARTLQCPEYFCSLHLPTESHSRITLEFSLELFPNLTITDDQQGYTASHSFPGIEEDVRTLFGAQSANEYCVLARAAANARIGLNEVWLHRHFVHWKPTLNELSNREFAKRDVAIDHRCPCLARPVKGEHQSERRRRRP